MAYYKYEFQDAAGAINAGVIDGPSLMEAARELRGRGVNLLAISPLSGAGGVLARLRSVSFELGPGLRDVLGFTSQLAVMIKAGISIRQAIDGIASQVENLPFRKILTGIKADVEAGQPFSDALARYPRIFPPLYVNMVRASELSGSFGSMLDRIAQYLSQQMETRSMVRGAMVYPCIIATMAVSTTIFLLTFVLPKFTTLFAGKESLLPAPTVALLAASDFLRNQWYIVVAIVGAIVVAAILALRTSRGRLTWDKLKLKLPLFKKMFRALYITRGLHTMGELVNAGVPMLQVLSITAEVSGNSVYKAMWTAVHASVKQGEKIGRQLARQKLLPASVVQMISAGEESGKLGEVMRDVAEFYSKELRGAIKAVTAMLEPLMIVIMGVIVGFIAMSIILPIFKMSSLAK